MKRAVIVICDGLRADMIRPDLTPNLCRLQAEARTYRNHRSVFPSTTRTTAASIATGCYPARHGLEGNCVALDEGRGLAPISAGAVEFRDRLRKATGKTLRVPTVSELLHDKGGGIVFSNVSPGAAYFHDPDGFGHVYHREGSFGPGLAPITNNEHLRVSHDADGDREMTERFCREILRERRPPYSVLWQCEPDHTQHACFLGSPEHLAVILSTDVNVGKVAEIIDQESRKGEDILFIVASDHGHETVSKLLPLSRLLIDAGLKDSENSSEVVIASNGLSANIYLSETGRFRLNDIINFLLDIEDLDRVIWGDELKLIGLNPDGNLAISVTTRNTEDANEFGVKGMSIAIEDPLHFDTNIGCGQHGGFGKFEQNPFLIVKGQGFLPASNCIKETSAVDLGPTVLQFLGMSNARMDGKPLSSGF